MNKQQEHRHCNKKLARLSRILFDFGVSSIQRTMIVNDRLRRSHSVNNSCDLKPKSFDILNIFYFKPEYLPQSLWRIGMRQQNQWCIIVP